jgi:hypothetical protein
MRKILILSGLLLGATLFASTTSTPAQAWVGCTCAKINAPAVCARGPVECTLGGGGVCVLPCDYHEADGKKHHRHHRHHKKK